MIFVVCTRSLKDHDHIIITSLEKHGTFCIAILQNNLYVSMNYEYDCFQTNST